MYIHVSKVLFLLRLTSNKGSIEHHILVNMPDKLQLWAVLPFFGNQTESAWLYCRSKGGCSLAPKSEECCD